MWTGLQSIPMIYALDDRCWCRLIPLDRLRIGLWLRDKSSLWRSLWLLLCGGLGLWVCSWLWLMLHPGPCWRLAGLWVWSGAGVVLIRNANSVRRTTLYQLPLHKLQNFLEDLPWADVTLNACWDQSYRIRTASGQDTGWGVPDLENPLSDPWGSDPPAPAGGGKQQLYP